MAARTQPTKFELRREATRAELIRLAHERFPVKGYAATSIEDIVRGSALSRGAYYFHFASKGDLFLACLEAREERRGDWAAVALDPALDGLPSMLEAVYRRLREVDGEHHLQWPMLQTEFWQTARSDAELAGRFGVLYRRWMTQLTRLLENARERGFIGLEGPLEPVAEVVFAMGQGMDIHREMYAADDRQYFTTLIRAVRG